MQSRLARLALGAAALLLSTTALPACSSDHDEAAEPAEQHDDADGDEAVEGLSTTLRPTLADLWSRRAHFVPDQKVAPVPGAGGHREAFAVERTDVGPNTIYLYHRCFRYPGGRLSIDICLDVSSDGGKTFPVSHGIVIRQSLGHFAVAPSVARIKGTWTMVWEEGGAASGTYWATSPNGITWSSHGALFGGSTYNATPSLYEFQDTVYVFSAQRSSRSQLGITFHSGPSMAKLGQYGGGFVVAPGGGGWMNGSVSMPRIVYQGGAHWMFFEGGTENLACGGSSEENDYGWGVARSTTLTHWQYYAGNPVNQGDDAESCGFDMPQPLLRGNGQVFVYHPSDNAEAIERDTLAFGSACGAGQVAPNWREKNFACLASCGGGGGKACYQTKNCKAGAPVTTNPAWPGMSGDCVSCCR